LWSGDSGGVCILSLVTLLSKIVNMASNKRGAGKGGVAVLWRDGRDCPALPDRERYAAA
jgi:hypothetical protein